MSKLPLVSLSLLAACAGVGTVQSVEDLPSAARAKAPDAMWYALVAQEPRSFIVALAPTASTDERAVASVASIERLAWSPFGAMPTSANRAAWSVHKARLLDSAPATERVIENDWDNLPLLQVRTNTVEAALAMLDRDEVAGAYEIEHYELSDAESFPLIGQPAAAAAGKTGAGTAVAVLDTGADYTRSDFGSCTAPGVPSTCKVAYAADFAPSDSSRDDNGHGTNVAGIVGGVAPGAKLIALDVFTGNSASSTDIISAVNWVIANRSTYNIAAMNLSLGGGASTSPCTTDAIGIALGTARSAGIAPVVASSNNGYSNAISSPACAPAAISVGAVYDTNLGGIGYGSCSDATTAADKITCFSNSASFLKLLAPGALISAAGYTMAGTSQATPHVAGAMAVLHAAFPGETVEQLLARLTGTGKRILDPRNNVTTPRIDVFAALGATATDTAPPTGTVAINGGAATTRTAQVTLAITGNDPSGVARMCVSNTTACTSFEAFATSKAWTLAAGDGRKTVTVVLRDSAGNTTTTTSPTASITLDTTAPSNGTVTARPGNAQVALSWSGFADGGSGVASYRVVGAASATAPASCNDTPLYAGTATAITVSGLSNGTAYSYRVCAVDGAQNVSTGATASAVARPESNAPVGAVQINAGAAFTRSPTVALTLVALDDTRVAQMCISEGTTCASFVAYQATASYTFAAGDGTRTLRVWYRDPYANTSAPVAASIIVDTTAPTGGILAATAGPDRNNLSWTAASDAVSGFAGYKLVGAAGTALPAAACATGTVLYSGTATAFAHVMTPRATWSYRLCAIDKAGNISAGTTKTVGAR